MNVLDDLRPAVNHCLATRFQPPSGTTWKLETCFVIDIVIIIIIVIITIIVIIIVIIMNLLPFLIIISVINYCVIFEVYFNNRLSFRCLSFFFLLLLLLFLLLLLGSLTDWKQMEVNFVIALPSVVSVPATVFLFRCASISWIHVGECLIDSRF